ncbi:hypothetical protein [Micromonospora sp. CPCC 205556]|uniref:hypothetical protein n=1 Tax=Micromonospora sp. CPCC 205556 TaxID=3122398 RepID=UPI002FF17B2C
MIFCNRPLARLGAAALLASGVFAGLGAPAYAEAVETDLSLDVVGTKVAADAQGKVAFARITNRGEHAPSKVTVTIDVSKVDFDEVAVLPIEEDCDLEGELKPTRWTCVLPPEALPGPGVTVDVPVVLFKAPDLEGRYAAPVTLTIVAPEDVNTNNDSRAATVEFSEEHGPDLVTQADDVTRGFKVTEDEAIPLEDLRAGDQAELHYLVANQGDQIALGLKSTIKLPEGVTFGAKYEHCDYDAAMRSVSCVWEDVLLYAVQDDRDDRDDRYSVIDVHFPIKVGKDVKPGTLTGGVVTTAAIATEHTTPYTAKAGLPSFIKGLPANATDVDASDNTDPYAVIVAEGNRGGSGGGGGGGGLPVTGPQAGLVGGVGAAVLAAGGAMFVLARRRRVVLVTPGDEKPTA